MLNVNLGPFALQVSHLLLLAALLVAAGVGHLVGRRQQIGIGNSLVDMLWAALLAGRLAFIVVWFELYRSAPWSMIDIRDGGFTLWAGLLAAAGVALWRGWRQPALRQPLLWGLTAGLLAWGALFGVIGALDKASKPGLPTVALTTLDGTPTDLAAMAKGKPMVVNLWASWCPPCRREMPVLAAAQQQETQVTFVFANQGEDSAAALRYLGAGQLNLANVLLDPNTALGRAIGSTALPTTLFYDASGQLVDTHLGELSAASLASKLNRLRTRTDPSTKEQTP
jgi:thiol-disulfide isomerase/thioredoxin